MREERANGQDPAVSVQNVSKSFGARRVLNDVSFEVYSGEAFCLLGRSGIGKSVTLKLLIGLVKPDSGRIMVDGHSIGDADAATLAEVRKKVGFLFQDGALFDSISVADNVAFPLERHTRKSSKEIREIVQEKLHEVELADEGKKMPSELSGGMRKRVGLARALVLDPPILLVDEPSSGLDRITAAEIYDLLLRLKQKRHVAQVVVTHDVIGARELATRFAVLDGGKIAAAGNLEELAHHRNALVRDLATVAEV
jgi:phospholipid/cholesterol/gamma-HCH transport system ATP-binding protein